MNGLPIVALDVDGVLAPIPEEFREIPLQALAHWSEDDMVQAKNPGAYGLHVAMPVIDFFKSIHERSLASICWNTSWQKHANDVLEPEFGLPSWPHLDQNNFYRTSTGWWKQDAVEAALTAGERVVWIDDDIADAIESGEVPKSLVNHPNLRIVSPDLRAGLTPSDLQQIEQWLLEWRA